MRSVRGLVPGLDSASPVAQQLPGVYQGEDFTERFVSVVDETLAPVFTTLDNLAAYVDPRTAPLDFVRGVGGWVGANRDDRTDEATQRLAVVEAITVHRTRGTAAGVRAVVAHLTGGEVRVDESGGTAWSVAPGAPLPGDASATVHVTVTVVSPESVDSAGVLAAVREVLPPYVTASVEVVAR